VEGAESQDLPYEPQPSGTAVLPADEPMLCLTAADLMGSSPPHPLLPRFPGTDFLNARNVPRLQDATPGFKQLDFNGFFKLLTLSF